MRHLIYNIGSEVEEYMKFSYAKYLQWCKDHKEPNYPWARECKGKVLESWNGEYGFIDIYLIEKEWVEE